MNPPKSLLSFGEFRTSRSGTGAALACTAAILFFSGRAGAVTVITNGTYDPAGGNNVDSSAAAAPNDVATFTTAVDAASTGGFGGVIHFDEFGANVAGTTLEATYASGTKTLNFSTTPGFNIQTLTSGTALSGRALLLPASDSATDDGGTLNLGSIVGGAALEAVTQLGFTVLSRNSTGYPQDVTITAFFSNGGSTVLVSNIVAELATDDTFFSFTAPAGASITSIVVNPANDTLDSRLVIDDLAFITSVVPEPSSAMMLLGGLSLLLASRRRA